MFSVFQFEVEWDGSENDKVVFLWWPCLVKRELKPPQDVGNDHPLLVLGKLLTYAVPSTQTTDHSHVIKEQWCPYLGPAEKVR